MKPSIENLAKLLIGKSAVSSLYVTTINSEKAFEITDVKVSRGIIYVKGDKTPWLTENVVDVLMETKEILNNDEIKETASKLKIVGTIKENNFEKVRDEVLNGNMLPVGSCYIIQTSDILENNYAFIRFPSGWRVVEEIFYLSKITEKDIIRALIGLTNMDLLDNRYQSKSGNMFLDAMLDASVYFFHSGVEYTNEDVFYYIKREYIINDEDIKKLVTLILPETSQATKSVNMEMFDKVYYKAFEIYRERKITQKEISDMLVSEGMQLTLSKFAAKIIKPQVLVTI